MDYVVGNYNNEQYAPNIGKTPDEIKADATLQTVFGMVMWGFGEVADGVFTDALGNTYTLGTDEVNAEIYWNNILALTATTSTRTPASTTKRPATSSLKLA